VIAVTSAGNTEVSSDGVTIVTENDVLSGVIIHDGEPCNVTGWFRMLIINIFMHVSCLNYKCDINW
jgi:hypothetical protein